VCIGEPQSTSSEDMFAFVNEKLNENYLTNHMSKVESCDSFSMNTGSNKYSFLFSNTVICTAIHGEGEKVNFRQNVMSFSLSVNIMQ
jgi:hypothetical protein